MYYFYNWREKGKNIQMGKYKLMSIIEEAKADVLPSPHQTFMSFLGTLTCFSNTKTLFFIRKKTKT